MLVEIPDPEVILSVILAFIVGLGLDYMDIIKFVRSLKSKKRIISITN